MDLWIRSQDKKTLSKINEDIIVVGSLVRKLLANENLWTDLGTYETKERALEVLEDITKNLCCMVEYGHPYNNNFVYEMPKE